MSSCYDCAKAQGHELECPRHERNRREEVLTVTVPKGFSVPNVGWTPPDVRGKPFEEIADAARDSRIRSDLKGWPTGSLEGEVEACTRTGCRSCELMREELAGRKARAAGPKPEPDYAKWLEANAPAVQDEAAEWRKLAVQPCPPGTVLEACWAVDEGAEKKGEAE